MAVIVGTACCGMVVRGIVRGCASREWLPARKLGSEEAAGCVSVGRAPVNGTNRGPAMLSAGQ